ncbi:MAG: glycosyltransferase family 4 protein [Clostridia bacterium]|nr:glycosyltransferase family 4 protein [Clostridia bacterium]
MIRAFLSSRNIEHKVINVKILYVTTIGGTMRFFRTLARELIEDGHTFEIAANTKTSPVRPEYYEMDCQVHNISCSRSPLSKNNFKAYKQLKKLIDENEYDIVHCHTPVAAMLTRLAARRARKKGTKVIYTAHGFHFYKGAPKKNWLIYFPIEWFCAFFTDVLININKDDYKFATKHIKAKKVEYVPGVGIDTSLFKRDWKAGARIREELGIPNDAKLLLSVGEINENKNHKCVINAIENLDVYYIIAGKGPKDKELQALIDAKGMTERVKLLGFRSDVADLYSAADAFVFPSFREGLPVSVMEAMATGLPVVCSKIRGSIDLVDYNGGEHFDPHSSESCKKALETLLLRDLEPIGEYNKQKVCEFNYETVNKKMKEIYFGGA